MRIARISLPPPHPQRAFRVVARSRLNATTFPERVRGSLQGLCAAFQKRPLKVLVASHINPDGDAIGSTIAMGLILETLGHTVTFYNQSPVPQNLLFLEGAERLARVLKPTVFDATILVDVNQSKRAGLNNLKPLQSDALGKRYVLDHHLTEGDSGAEGFVDADAPATAVLVYRFAKLTGVKITPAIASAIYCGIITDTESFRYTRNSAELFRISAELVEAGANSHQIAESFYDNLSPNRLNLLRDVLGTLEIAPNGRWAMLYISNALLSRHSCTVEDTEGMVNICTSIKGVEVGILMRENDNGSFKVSMRSRAGGTDVRAICEALGGGGHISAAGCNNLKGTQPDVKQTVITQVEREL